MKDKNHDGCEVWVATDNKVWVVVWNKSISTAKHLFYLMVFINVAAYEHSVFAKCFHIS